MTKKLDPRDALKRLQQMEADAAVIRDRLESEAQAERDERVAAHKAKTVQEFETHRKNLDLGALTKEPLERIATAAATFERELLAAIDDLSDACERYNSSVTWYNRKRHILGGSEERHRSVYLEWIATAIADKVRHLTLSGRDDHHFGVRLSEAGGLYGASIKVTLNRITKLSPSLFRR